MFFPLTDAVFAETILALATFFRLNNDALADLAHKMSVKNFLFMGWNERINFYDHFDVVLVVPFVPLHNALDVIVG
jgi:hypothetical protein